MASGVLKIQPFWDVLGPAKAKALPTFHAFSVADNTGKFARVEKATWFKIFLEADDNTIEALKKLSDDTEVTEELLTSLESCVCAAYSPKGIQIKSIPELQLHLFCK